LLLSDSEGLPNSLLEAGFAGRPALATDVGGTPEVVGQGGILVPLDDPAATAAAMTELVSDASRRERLGQAIWRHVADSYSISGMVAAHVDALEETLARRRGPR
jgi:glycosyltransferase involved in cell wall biosynthesis